METTMSKTILIYKDYGCLIGTTDKQLLSWLHITLDFRYNIEFTDATSILELDILNNKNIVALVIPGGHSYAYENKLNSVGATKIQEFINNGGIYLGICGGAYYASQTIIFNKNYISHSLSLLKGVAKGPLPDLTCGHGYDHTPFAFNAVSLHFEDTQHNFCNMLYAGGCTFVNLQTEHQVLATYAELNMPAAIRFGYGKGKVVLLGVHPEAIPADYFQLAESSFYKQEERQHILDYAKILEHSINNKSHINLSRIFLNDLL